MTSFIDQYLPRLGLWLRRAQVTVIDSIIEDPAYDSNVDPESAFLMETRRKRVAEIHALELRLR